MPQHATCQLPGLMGGLMFVTHRSINGWYMLLVAMMWWMREPCSRATMVALPVGLDDSIDYFMSKMGSPSATFRFPKTEESTIPSVQANTEVDSPSAVPSFIIGSIDPLTIERPPHIVRGELDQPMLRHFAMHQEQPQAIGSKASPRSQDGCDPLSAAEQGREDTIIT